MILESTGSIGQRDIGTSSIPLWTSTIEITEEGDDSKFQDEWATGQMMLVADGSSKNGLGTGAWIFTSLRLYNQGKYIEASAISPGPAHFQDSHRAECIGLLGGLRMVQQKLHSWRVDTGHIVVACDNISALKYAVLRSTYKYIHSHIPDYDVLQACRSVMEPGIDYEYHHVRGHQDELGVTLDIYETLNVRMDLLAKRRREIYENEHSQRYSQHMRLPNEQWYLSAGDHKLCRHLNSQIYEHISYQNISKYWSKDEENGGRHVDSVDWEGVKNAIQQLPKHRQHWISKHVFGECGVNEVLKLRKEKDTDLCKRCGSIETTAHVWHCKAPEVSRLWQQSVEVLNHF
jgi:ribonuclease HI